MDQIEDVDIPEKIDETWHFASSLKYLAKDYSDIYNVNINFLKCILNLHKKAARIGAKFFYASTAYVGGENFSLVTEEEIKYSDDMIFNNEYERTKLMAENLIMDAVRYDGINANILRPSVVIGDKHEGRLVNYHGYYLGVQALNEFKKYHSRWSVSDTEFRIIGMKSAETNLIPIDDCIDIMYRIAASSPVSGMIFNVVNRKGVTLEQLIRVAEKNFGLNFICCEDKDFIGNPKNKHERMLSLGAGYVMPYCKLKIEFDASNTTSVLGTTYSYELSDERLYEMNQKYI